jgi:XTP/dITP diphosphohydrolase
MAHCAQGYGEHFLTQTNRSSLMASSVNLTSQARLAVPDGKILVGTNNPQKLAALSALLADYRIDFETAAGLESPEEIGTTVVENALIKARAFARMAGCAALSDDTGFMISAIGDAPGAAAINWAGPEKDFEIALAKVRARLMAAGRFDGPAYYETCIALALPDGSAIFETARAEGFLLWPPAGPTDGYLSIFARTGETLSLSQQKAALPPGRVAESFGFSHRDIAVHNLLSRLDFPARGPTSGQPGATPQPHHAENEKRVKP